jgi:replication factor C subunit 3/5
MTRHIQLLSETLRPSNLADLNLPDNLRSSFERMVKRRSIINLLFYGKPGIGKTSAARILLKEIDADVYEINGSFNKGEKTMVNGIEGFSSTLSFEDKPKVCFIDEADHMSKEVQASLRHIIEKLSSTTRFLLTANEVDRLTPALMSRCSPICFDVFPTDIPRIIDTMVARYKIALETSGYTYEESRLRNIVSVYFPDLREIANRLELEFV